MVLTFFLSVLLSGLNDEAAFASFDKFPVTDDHRKLDLRLYNLTAADIATATIYGGWRHSDISKPEFCGFAMKLRKKLCTSI